MGSIFWYNKKFKKELEKVWRSKGIVFIFAAAF